MSSAERYFLVTLNYQPAAHNEGSYFFKSTDIFILEKRLRKYFAMPYLTIGSKQSPYSKMSDLFKNQKRATKRWIQRCATSPLAQQYCSQLHLNKEKCCIRFSCIRLVYFSSNMQLNLYRKTHYCKILHENHTFLHK